MTKTRKKTTAKQTQQAQSKNKQTHKPQQIMSSNSNNKPITATREITHTRHNGQQEQIQHTTRKNKFKTQHAKQNKHIRTTSNNKTHTK